MSLLFDTSVAILLRDGDPTVRAQMDDLDGLPSISLITLVELHGGSATTREAGARRRERLGVLMGTVGVVDFDRAIVDAYDAILRTVGFSRRRVLDRLIAATAIVNGLTLITTNGPDFRDIPGLRLEVWPTPAQ